MVPNHELLEIHRSKISLHRAKTEYSYPTIRLPHTFSALAGLSTRIYQTVHNGALAFLVVVSSTSKSSPGKHEKASLSAESSVFTRRRSPVPLRRAHCSFLANGATLKAPQKCVLPTPFAMGEGVKAFLLLLGVPLAPP